MCESALSVVTRMLKPRKKKEKKELGEEVVSPSLSLLGHHVVHGDCVCDLHVLVNTAYGPSCFDVHFVCVHVYIYFLILPF